MPSELHEKYQQLNEKTQAKVRRKVISDPELIVMATLWEKLKPLSERAKGRIIRYLVDWLDEQKELVEEQGESELFPDAEAEL